MEEGCEAMNMIDTLNKEHDKVLSENITIKEENEKLKEENKELEEEMEVFCWLQAEKDMMGAVYDYADSLWYEDSRERPKLCLHDPREILSMLKSLRKEIEYYKIHYDFNKEYFERLGIEPPEIPDYLAEEYLNYELKDPRTK